MASMAMGAPVASGDALVENMEIPDNAVGLGMFDFTAAIFITPFLESSQ